ncbi:MAG: hypothetical protein IIB87_07900, partial [Chloroflexi bacterium]|nr:hypothetical protein [Chloroflexota bacterium]
MTRILTAAIAILFLGAAAVASLSTAGAQSEIDVRVNNARSDFPNGIVFNLTAATAGGLDEVRLIYSIAPDGVRASAVPECTGEAVASCRFELLATPRNLLIPGAQVTYFWQLTSGDLTEETAPQEVLYEDSRFEWRSLTDGNLTVWWYNGSDDEARGILTAGHEALTGIGALLETSVDFPVKIRYYASAADMQAAIISTSGPGVVTRGEVVYSDTAMVSADSAAGDITRHEVAHIVVREAVRGPFGVPDWLNEGTAVFAQNQPLGDQRSALEAAIRNGNVFSVRSISSASAGALSSNVSLFYGQSWSLVQYLIDTYGEAQFAQLFRAFKEGDTTGGALESTYGFDQDGLENEWRASVGLPPRAAPPPGGGVAEPDVPTPVAGVAADST